MNELNFIETVIKIFKAKWNMKYLMNYYIISISFKIGELATEVVGMFHRLFVG